jgi:hypothetical protein
MSLSRNEINPLNVLNHRKLKFIPEHFAKISVGREIEIKLLEQWINYNLNSRYAIKRTYIVDQNNRLIEVYEIGIEDPKELTMLTLGCPYIHKKREELF